MRADRPDALASPCRTGAAVDRNRFPRRIDAHGAPHFASTPCRPRRLGDFRVAAAIAWPLFTGAGRGARAGRHRRRRRAGDRRGGQHLDLADGRRATAPCRRCRPARRSRSSSTSSSRTAAAAGRRQAAAHRSAAPRQFARLRLHHRSVRPRRHQQPRDRRCRRDQRHPQRRHQAEGRAGRQGHQDRPRGAASVKPRQAAQGGEVRRLATSCGSANG